MYHETQNLLKILHILHNLTWDLQVRSLTFSANFYLIIFGMIKNIFIHCVLGAITLEYVLINRENHAVTVQKETLVKTISVVSTNLNKIVVRKGKKRILLQFIKIILIFSLFRFYFGRAMLIFSPF